MKRKLLILCTLFVLLSAILVAFIASNQSLGQAHAADTITSTTKTVTIVNFTYKPAKLTITVGTVIIWKNMDSVAHTVTSNNGKTFNHVISPGGTYRFKFTRAGTYKYHCAFHPFMTAQIIVK